jgi:hypothetical protein
MAGNGCTRREHGKHGAVGSPTGAAGGRTIQLNAKVEF